MWKMRGVARFAILVSVSASRDDFCVAVTGKNGAFCETTTSVCHSVTGLSMGEYCSIELIETYAARFEALRDEPFALMPFEPELGMFDFLEQISAPTYSDFLRFRSRNSQITPQTKGALRGLFGESSQRAIQILTELFLSVPGSNWVDPYYEPVCEGLAQHDAVPLMEELVIYRNISSREDNYTSGEMRRGPPHPSHMKVWAMATARTLVRFSDDEHLEYVTALRTALDDDSVSAEIAEWLYLLATRTTLYLRPPVQETRFRTHIRESNSATESLRSGNWLTADLLPQSLGPSTEESLLHAATIFASQTDVRVYRTAQRVTGLRLLEKMAGMLGFHTLVFFELIAPEWLEWAMEFEPQPHHLLDAVLCISSVLAKSHEASLEDFLAILNAAGELGLETIERDSLGLRREAEFRFIRATLAQFEIDQGAFAAMTIDKPLHEYPCQIQKSILYMQLYARVAEEHMPGRCIRSSSIFDLLCIDCHRLVESRLTSVTVVR